jgi:hypothetical protein
MIRDNDGTECPTGGVYRDVVEAGRVVFTWGTAAPAVLWWPTTSAASPDLHARDTTLILVSPAPPAQIKPYQERRGWTGPWFSMYGNDFTVDCGAGEGFGVSVFRRDDDNVYRSRYTTGRGVDSLVGTLRYLDLTPLGRQGNNHVDVEPARLAPGGACTTRTTPSRPLGVCGARNGSRGSRGADVLSMRGSPRLPAAPKLTGQNAGSGG